MLIGIPKTIFLIIQGIIILFIAGDYVFKFIQKREKEGGSRWVMIRIILIYWSNSGHSKTGYASYICKSWRHII